MQENNEKQTYKLGDFEGPLELLLFLINKNEINIYDIPISEITEQYLEYLEYSTKIDLDNITEFYLMASTLLYIKSCMLLPVDIDYDTDYEDPRKDLVEKLIEYQKYKKLGELMKDKENEMEWTIERKKNQLILPFDDIENMWEEISVWDIFKYFSQVVSNLSSEKIMVFYEEVSVNEKISLVYELLDSKMEFSFYDLIRKGSSCLEIVCAFIAILELVKTKTIRILQNRFFGEIRICKYS